ncbi:MAG TPA: carbohydrate-binding protein, partial [Rubrivivax sp.]|nr:carbohydrate-binding protein [Rubrivivax sp.]
LVAAMAQGSPGSPTSQTAREAFVPLGELSRIAADTPYIVTLDSDTQLPPGRLRELVGVAAHPQNRPRLSEDGRTVTRGYGILQPRVVTPLPAPREFTIYHWLFAGQCGIDPYSAASSEVYQDLFGEGSFSGKGLLDVEAMHAVLGGRLPEGQVLSHDLLEGAVARCAAVTDIALIEDAPFHADVAAARVHRWTRGDWQLLPFLLGAPRPGMRPAGPPWGARKPGAARALRDSPLPQPRRYRLRAVNRWKMFDNLRRSLVAPMSRGLLLLTLAGFALSPWAALALVLAAFTAGPLMGAVAGLSPSRDNVAKRYFYRQGATDLARAVLGGLWHLGQLLHASTMAVDAIVRALYRLFVSHRHLLQWTTAAAAQAQAKSRLGAVLRKHWTMPAVSLLLLGALFAAGTPTPALSLALCALWAASPVWTWWVSRRPPARRDATLPLRDQAYLHGIARDTWRYFERCVSADDQHLPPDNLKTSPHDMLAHRTSPTNIGLYLLAAACARQFGWIGTQELMSRLEATLATMDRLPRHRGHFLNWYDTQTGAALLPMYVSTVDSGNLAGHLLAVGQACRERAAAPFDGRAALTARHASAQRLAPLLAS